MLKLGIIILGLLAFLLIPSVAAAPTISFSVAGNIDNLEFVPMKVVEDSTGIKLTSIQTTDITNSWKITVCDYSDGKDPKYAGRMAEWDGSQYVMTDPLVLATNVTVMGYGGTDISNSTATLGPTPVIIEQGITNGYWDNIPVSIKQYTDFSDQLLSTGHSYRTIITFEGTAS